MQRFENVNAHGNLLVVSIVLVCGLWLGGIDLIQRLSGLDLRAFLE